MHASTVYVTARSCLRTRKPLRSPRRRRRRCVRDRRPPSALQLAEELWVVDLRQPAATLSPRATSARRRDGRRGPRCRCASRPTPLNEQGLRLDEVPQKKGDDHRDRQDDNECCSGMHKRPRRNRQRTDIPGGSPQTAALWALALPYFPQRRAFAYRPPSRRLASWGRWQLLGEITDARQSNPRCVAIAAPLIDRS